MRKLDLLGLLTAVRGQAGFLEAQVQVSQEDEDHVLVTASWASPAHFERWRESAATAEVLRALGPLLRGEPRAELYRVVDAIG